MTHKKVFECFNRMFPGWRGSTDAWFPYGNSMIKIRLNNKMEFIFTYFNENNWKLETLDRFSERRRKR